MEVPDEIKSLIERAKELYQELIDEYEKCIKEGIISDKAKIITNDVLTHCRSALDHAMRVYLNIKYSLLYSEEQRERFIVYFPITSTINGFRGKLKSAKMQNLENDDPAVYNFLLNLQIFSNESFRNKWFYQLTKLTGIGKHMRLIQQRREDFEHHTVESPFGRVSWANPIVTFNPSNQAGVRTEVLGAPIDPLTQRIIPQPGISETVETIVSFIIENNKMDGLWYLKIIQEQTDKLLRNFFNLF